LIVLERLEQWLEHKIEPPKELAIHAEWVKRRAAADDAIAKKMGNAEFEKRLLGLWQERVLWWNNPKPKLETPKSGLFDNATTRVQRVARPQPGSIRQYSARRPSTSVEAESVEVMAAWSDEAMVVRSAVRMASAAGSRSFAKSKSSLGPQAMPSVAATVTLKAWDPKTSYIDAIKAAAKEEAYKVYLTESEQFGNSPAFYLDCAGWFFSAGEAKLAKRIVSNLAEFKLEDSALWRVMGWRLREAKAYDESVRALRHLLALRGEEGQSYRDLALVLVERGKGRFANGKLNDAAADIAEAMKMFHKCIFENHARRSARRSNDIQVAIIALEELNALIWWSAEQDWQSVKPPEPPEMDASYRRDLPMDLRIVLSWDADETDIDIHVLEPNCEEAYYGHRRTREGGFVGEDVTTGYGPEEYLAKTAQKGIFKVLCNYFASHQQSLTGPVSVTATVYTNWSRKDEKSQVLTLRLDKPKSKNIIGEIVID
jgi:tetratricopeptide (TPR) repeat protein